MYGSEQLLFNAKWSIFSSISWREKVTFLINHFYSPSLLKQLPVGSNKYQFYSHGLNRPGFEPPIYNTRGEYNNHYTIDDVICVRYSSIRQTIIRWGLWIAKMRFIPSIGFHILLLNLSWPRNNISSIICYSAIRQGI